MDGRRAYNTSPRIRSRLSGFRRQAALIRLRTVKLTASLHGFTGGFFKWRTELPGGPVVAIVGLPGLAAVRLAGWRRGVLVPQSSIFVGREGSRLRGRHESKSGSKYPLLLQTEFAPGPRPSSSAPIKVNEASRHAPKRTSNEIIVIPFCKRVLINSPAAQSNDRKSVEFSTRSTGSKRQLLTR